MTYRLNPGLSEVQIRTAMMIADGICSERLLEVQVEDQWDGPPLWYSRLLTHLTLLATDDTIEAVFPHHRAGDPNMRAVVLTSSRIIDATIELTPQALPSARVISRRRVTGVGVRTQVGVYTADSVKWPRLEGLDVILDGIDKPILLAPPAIASHGRPMPDLANVLIGLLNDLDGGVRTR